MQQLALLQDCNFFYSNTTLNASTRLHILFYKLQKKKSLLLKKIVDPHAQDFTPHETLCLLF